MSFFWDTFESMFKSNIHYQGSRLSPKKSQRHWRGLCPCFKLMTLNQQMKTEILSALVVLLNQHRHLKEDEQLPHRVELGQLDTVDVRLMGYAFEPWTSNLYFGHNGSGLGPGREPHTAPAPSRRHDEQGGRHQRARAGRWVQRIYGGRVAIG